MAGVYGIGFQILLIAGAIILQIYLSKKQKIWYGLIMPIILIFIQFVSSLNSFIQEIDSIFLLLIVLFGKLFISIIENNLALGLLLVFFVSMNQRHRTINKKEYLNSLKQP